MTTFGKVAPLTRPNGNFFVTLKSRYDTIINYYLVQKSSEK